MFRCAAAATGAFKLAQGSVDYAGSLNTDSGVLSTAVDAGNDLLYQLTSLSDSSRRELLLNDVKVAVMTQLNLVHDRLLHVYEEPDSEAASQAVADPIRFRCRCDKFVELPLALSANGPPGPCRPASGSARCRSVTHWQ